MTVAPPARATPEPGARPLAASPAAPPREHREHREHPDLPDPSPGVRLFPRPEVDLPVPADGTLAEIERKVHAGERLSFEDGLALYAAPDLLWLGGLARAAQRRISGDRVYFNVNRHINLTNVCKARCAFCSFRRDEGEEGAYTMTVEEAVAAARETASALDITELHIVNGLHPGLPFDYYLEALRALKERPPPRAPQGLHRGGGVVVRPPHRDDLRGRAAGPHRRRPGLPPRRRSGDLRPPRARGASVATSPPPRTGYTCTAPPTPWA